MSRQSTSQQLIEAMDKRIQAGTMDAKQMQRYLDLIDDLRGEDANRVYRVPPLEVAPGEFQKGKVKHR